VLAREACEIEIDVLGKPIGKQDQYIAAYGGVRYIRFLRDGGVAVQRIDMDGFRYRQLDESLMLFYTGITRQASEVLTEQKQNIASRMSVLKKMRDQAESVRGCLSDSRINRLGQILRSGWELKKSLAANISSSHIDELYEKALKAGATGGKVAGAGGGGFLLLFCQPAYQYKVRKALANLKELPFRLERDGTKVIFNVRR
jgi:D-glycero-alpha-D-manno-heptose-7-phosphate kinase